MKKNKVIFDWKSADLLSMSENEPGKIDYVLPALPVGSVGLLAGAGGVGKTFWVTQAVMQVAVGGSCDFGLGGPAKVKSGGQVLYFNLEDPESILHQRIRSISLKYKKNIKENGVINTDGEREFNASYKYDESWVNDALENIEYYALSGKNISILDKNGDLNEYTDTFISIAKSVKHVRLIVFDTLRRCHDSEENGNGSMAKVLRFFEWLASETGAAVLIVHHENKHGQNDPDAGASAIRGASAIVDNCRWVARMRHMSKNEAEEMNISYDDGESKKYVNIGLPKINYAEGVPDAWLKREGEGVLFETKLNIVKKVSSLAKTAFGLKSSRDKRDW